MTSIISKYGYDAAVVGAGPAGVMAAIRAAGKGLRVLILEKNEKPLKKLYATGNGRCNFSNLVMDGDVYRGSNAAKIRDIVSRFDRDSLIAFFENMGMMTKDIDGYFYPYNEQARTVASALLMEAEGLGVEVRCDEQVVDICRIVEDAPETVNPDGENLSLRSSTGRDKVFRYIIKTGNMEYRCRSLVLAVGGKASPAHGSDGNLNNIVRSLGHTMIKQKPALVPLCFRDTELAKLQGVRVKCAVSLNVGGEEKTRERGEIIFNKDNISGIPIMQMSRYATCREDKRKSVTVDIDLFPDECEGALAERLYRMFYGENVGLAGDMSSNEAGRHRKVAENRKAAERTKAAENIKAAERLISDHLRSGRTALDALSLCLNEKLAGLCLDRAGIYRDIAAVNVSAERLTVLREILKRFSVEITGNAGFERAQVTAGGVPLDELTDDLESVVSPGLFIVGELCDVDGTCGGYNLQWAFSSGAVAGMSIIEN